MYSRFSRKSSIDVMCRVSKTHTDPVPAPTRRLNCGLSPMVYASFVGPTPACHDLSFNMKENSIFIRLIDIFGQLIGKKIL